MTVPRESDVRVPADLVETERSIRVHQEYMKAALCSLLKCELRESVVTTIEVVK